MDFIYGKKVNVKKIIISESGSDFAAITAYNRVMMLIEKVTNLYAEWIKML